MREGEEVTIGQCTLYLGDCRDILPTLGHIDAVVTDPPYGIDWDTDYTRFTGGACQSRSSSRIIGDAQGFLPTTYLNFPQVILWGANHFAQHLPSGSWLVWDKRPPTKRGKFLSDCELAWWNHGNGSYLYSQEWDGFNRAGERHEARTHPTQKPIALMRWCVQKTSGVVLDPYAGSFTTVVACLQLGRPCIAIEIEPHYWELGCRRVEAAYAQLDLMQPQTWQSPQQLTLA